jgi:hypothetical protein
VVGAHWLQSAVDQISSAPETILSVNRASKVNVQASVPELVTVIVSWAVAPAFTVPGPAIDKVITPGSHDAGAGAPDADAVVGWSVAVDGSGAVAGAGSAVASRESGGEGVRVVAGAAFVTAGDAVFAPPTSDTSHISRAMMMARHTTTKARRNQYTRSGSRPGAALRTSGSIRAS